MKPQTCDNCFFKVQGYAPTWCKDELQDGWCGDWTPANKTVRASPPDETGLHGRAQKLYQFTTKSNGRVFIIAASMEKGYNRLKKLGVPVGSIKKHNILNRESFPKTVAACLKNRGWCYGDV